MHIIHLEAFINAVELVPLGLKHSEKHQIFLVVGLEE